MCFSIYPVKSAEELVSEPRKLSKLVSDQDQMAGKQSGGGISEGSLPV